MAEHPNIALARETVDAYGRGDQQRLNELYADDIVWHVGGDHRFSGAYRGRDELFGYFEKVGELTAGSLRLELGEAMADDEYAALFVRVTAQREGRSLDTELAEVLHMGADGRWDEYWALADDQPAVDTFWA